MTQHSQHAVCHKSQNKIDNYTCSGRNNEVKLEFTLLDLYFDCGNMSTRLCFHANFLGASLVTVSFFHIQRTFIP